MEYVDVKMENPFGTVVFSVHPFFLRSHTNGKMSPPLKRCNYLPQESFSFFGHKKDFLPSSILFENDSEIVTKCFEQLCYY